MAKLTPFVIAGHGCACGTSGEAILLIGDGIASSATTHIPPQVLAMTIR